MYNLQCTDINNIKTFSRWNRLGFDSRGFQPTGVVISRSHRCFLAGQLKKYIDDSVQFTVKRLNRLQLQYKQLNKNELTSIDTNELEGNDLDFNY